MGVTFLLGELVVFGAESVFHPGIPLVPPKVTLNITFKGQGAEEHTVWKKQRTPSLLQNRLSWFLWQKSMTLLMEMEE